MEWLPGAVWLQRELGAVRKERRHRVTDRVPRMGEAKRQQRSASSPSILEKLLLYRVGRPTSEHRYAALV